MKDKRVYKIAMAVFMLAMLLGPGLANADPVQVTDTFQGPGLTVTTVGVGTRDTWNHTLTVAGVAGTVQHAYLYWSGRQRCTQNPVLVDTWPCQTSDGGGINDKDKYLTINGQQIVGTLVGTELQQRFATDSSYWYLNVGYRAEVTNIVNGNGNYTLGDYDPTTERSLESRDGASLVVIWSDPADPQSYKVQLAWGVDFAWYYALTQQNRQTDPVTFNVGSEPNPRTGEMAFFVGDAQAMRPDTYVITTGNTNVPGAFNNDFTSNQGAEWDVQIASFQIPAGASTVTAQVQSVPNEACGTTFPNCDPNSPDSLLWAGGYLRIPINPPPSTCTSVSSIVSNFNGTAIAAGRTIWFNGVTKVSGLSSKLFAPI